MWLVGVTCLFLLSLRLCALHASKPKPHVYVRKLASFRSLGGVGSALLSILHSFVPTHSFTCTIAHVFHPYDFRIVDLLQLFSCIIW